MITILAWSLGIGLVAFWFWTHFVIRWVGIGPLPQGYEVATTTHGTLDVLVLRKDGEKITEATIFRYRYKESARTINRAAWAHYNLTRTKEQVNDAVS